MRRELQSYLSECIQQKCGIVLTELGFHLDLTNASEWWYLFIKYVRDKDIIVFDASWFPTDYPSHKVDILLARQRWSWTYPRFITLDGLRNRMDQANDQSSAYSLLDVDSQTQIDSLVHRMANDISSWAATFLHRNYTEFDREFKQNRKRYLRNYSYVWNYVKNKKQSPHGT
jgi:hypothetical protein